MSDSLIYQYWLFGLEHAAAETAAAHRHTTAHAADEAAHAAAKAAHATAEAAHATHALTSAAVTEQLQTVSQGCHEVAGDALVLSIST